MLVFNTEMHIVTFIFVILEVLMFFYQFIYYLSRPNDKNRLWYLVLLFLLIIYNVTGGLFPDPQIEISVITQNIIAYGSGFLMASYFPYYFYRAFHLERLRFHALYGVPLFLIAPYIVFFVIGYSFTGNLESAIRYGIVVPFFYSIVLLWAILRAIRLKFMDNSKNSSFLEVLAVYLAVVPWASMTVFAYFHVGQLVEVIFTNCGFIVITIMFISRSVVLARLEYERFLQISQVSPRSFTFAENCKTYQLTYRETEIVQLIRQGIKYKMIAENLFISEKTVNKHVQNIFEKVGVSNKVELLNKLEAQRQLPH